MLIVSGCKWEEENIIVLTFARCKFGQFYYI